MAVGGQQTTIEDSGAQGSLQTGQTYAKSGSPNSFVLHIKDAALPETQTDSAIDKLPSSTPEPTLAVANSLVTATLELPQTTDTLAIP